MYLLTLVLMVPAATENITNSTGSEFCLLHSLFLHRDRKYLTVVYLLVSTVTSDFMFLTGDLYLLNSMDQYGYLSLCIMHASCYSCKLQISVCIRLVQHYQEIV